MEKAESLALKPVLGAARAIGKEMNS